MTIITKQTEIDGDNHKWQIMDTESTKEIFSRIGTLENKTAAMEASQIARNREFEESIAKIDSKLDRQLVELGKIEKELHILSGSREGAMKTLGMVIAVMAAVSAALAAWLQ